MVRWHPVIYAVTTNAMLLSFNLSARSTSITTAKDKRATMQINVGKAFAIHRVWRGDMDNGLIDHDGFH